MVNVPKIVITGLFMLLFIGGMLSLAQAQEFAGFDDRDGLPVYDLPDMTTIGVSDPFPVNDYTDNGSVERQAINILDVTSGLSAKDHEDGVSFNGEVFINGINSKCIHWVRANGAVIFYTESSCLGIRGIDTKYKYDLNSWVAKYNENLFKIQLGEFFLKYGSDAPYETTLELSEYYRKQAGTFDDVDALHGSEIIDHAIDAYVRDNPKLHDNLNEFKWFIQELFGLEDILKFDSDKEYVYSAVDRDFHELGNGNYRELIDWYEQKNSLEAQLEAAKLDLLHARLNAMTAAEGNGADSEDVEDLKKQFIEREKQYDWHLEEIRSKKVMMEGIMESDITCDNALRVGDFDRVIKCNADKIDIIQSKIKLGENDYSTRDLTVMERYTVLGMESYSNGNYNEALKYFILTGNHISIANSYRQMDDHTTAAYHYYMAGNNADALNGLAYSNMMIGNKETAITFHNMAIDADPVNIDSYNGLGMAYRISDNCGEAGLYYSMASEINIDNADTKDGLQRLNDLCN